MRIRATTDRPSTRSGSARRAGAWLAACVLALAPSAPGIAQAPPLSASAGDAARSAPPENIAFLPALLREYAELIQSDGDRYRGEFGRAYFERKLQALARGEAVAPERPRRTGPADVTAYAQSEGRVRLMRLFEFKADEKQAALAAKAQAEFDCWVARAASRLGRDAVRDCERRFATTVRQIEDALVPLRTPHEFTRTLAREYLAFAAYKTGEENDLVDARHFAAKGVRAAEAKDADEVLPEIVSKWPFADPDEAKAFGLWRERLIRALDAHRTGDKAATAAFAQARFDCWVERASEKGAPGAVQRCRGEFVDAMRALEGAPAFPAETVALRFDMERANLRHADWPRLKAAAAAALERNAATITIVAYAEGTGAQAQALRLAERRADGVARELERLGVPADRIAIKTVPQADAASAKPGSRRPDEQRVEIVID